jgi:hypothetical protein
MSKRIFFERMGSLILMNAPSVPVHTGSGGGTGMKYGNVALTP